MSNKHRGEYTMFMDLVKGAKKAPKSSKKEN